MSKERIIVRAKETLDCVDDDSIRLLNYAIGRLESNEKRYSKKLSREVKNCDFKNRLYHTKKDIGLYKEKCKHPIVIKLSDGSFICPFCRTKLDNFDDINRIIDLSENPNFTSPDLIIAVVRELINRETNGDTKMGAEKFVKITKKVLESMTKKDISRYTKNR